MHLRSITSATACFTIPFFKTHRYTDSKFLGMLEDESDGVGLWSCPDAGEDLSALSMLACHCTVHLMQQGRDKGSPDEE